MITFYFSSHSFPEVVAILAYLCDLVRDIKKYAVATEMPKLPCDQLMNNEFMDLFVSETRRNYEAIFGEKDDQQTQKPPQINNDENVDLLDEEGQTKLLNGYVATKMKIDGLTIEELAAREKKLRQSSEELEKNLIKSDCEKYFNSIEEQLAQKEKEYLKIQEILVEKRKYLKMVTMTHDEKRRKLKAKQMEIQKLMQQIDHQKYTLLDVKQLMAKETSIKNSITMIQNANHVIQEEAADAQVKLARLQKLKLDSIKKFNEFTFNVIKILMQSQAFQQLNIIDYTIDPIASTETIQNMCLRLNRLNERCATVKQEYIQQIEQNKVTLAEYKSQYNRLKEKYADQKSKFQMANKNMEILNQKCTNYETDRSISMTKLRREITEKIATKQQIDDEIKMLRKKAEEMGIKNTQLFEDGERQAQEIVRAKQTFCQELDELNNKIDDFSDVA